VNCARGAGAHNAAVTYGYGDRESLEAATPEFTLDHFAQVFEIIK
jgi:phosphoglycolate phosphatase-like HAD superfamily hydrolase